MLGPSYFGSNIAPVAVESYINKVGDMIDIQYLSIPLTIKLKNSENNKTVWYSLEKLESTKEVEQEIRDKVQILYEKYKDKINY